MIEILIGVVVAAAGVMVVLAQRLAAKTKELEDKRGYEETRKRIDAADLGDDADGARKWLHDRQSKRDL